MLFFTYYSTFEDIEGKPPYPEFKKVSGIRIEERVIDDPSKFGSSNVYDREHWYLDGKNHRLEHGHIKRDFDEEFYVIEINTLEDLFKFQATHNTSASVSLNSSGYIVDGKELPSFYYDYYME